MSAVVTYGFDDFAVVATDTRVHHGDRYRDDEWKLWPLEGIEGWAAGVGYDAILRSVAQVLESGPGDIGERLARAEELWNVGTSTLLSRFPDARRQIEGTALVATFRGFGPDTHRWIVVSKEGARVTARRSVVLPESLAPHVPTYPYEFDHPSNDLEIRINGTVRAAAAFLDVISRRTSGISPTADIGVSFPWAPPSPGSSLRSWRCPLRFRGPAAKIARTSDDERLREYEIWFSRSRT